MHDLGVASPTAAAADAVAAERPRIDRIVDRFTLQTGQCGAVDTVGERWCVDRVSRASVFAPLDLKLLAGYALLRSARRGHRPMAGRSSSCSVRRRPGRPAGLGEDVRLDGTGVIGSGLRVEGELVQLSAYAAD